MPGHIADLRGALGTVCCIQRVLNECIRGGSRSPLDLWNHAGCLWNLSFTPTLGIVEIWSVKALFFPWE